jgi:CBS domain-containing protein
MPMLPTVENLVSGKIYSIRSGRSVREAAEEMARKKIGSLLIAHEGAYIGIITEVDIIRKVVANGIDPAAIPVQRVMSSPVVAIDAGRSIVEANDLMERKKIRHLAVTRDGLIVGLVSVRDFLRPLHVEEASSF